MLTAKLGHRHPTFGLTQDLDDLRLSVSACLHSESPRSSCRENSTYAAPYFRGGVPGQGHPPHQFTVIDERLCDDQRGNNWLSAKNGWAPEGNCSPVRTLIAHAREGFFGRENSGAALDHGVGR